MNETVLFIAGTLLTIIGTLALIILNSLNNTITKAVESINELNIRVAKVIAAVEYHDERIKRLEDLRENV